MVVGIKSKMASTNLSNKVIVPPANTSQTQKSNSTTILPPSQYCDQDVTGQGNIADDTSIILDKSIRV